MEINKTKKQPWASWDEWENCYNLLFSNLNSDNKYENNKIETNLETALNILLIY